MMSVPSTTTPTAAAKADTESKHWLNAWHVTPSANRDYDFIDGLRGIAILMVIAAHHFYVNPDSGFAMRLVGNLLGTGGYGVTLFFTLSGFLIAWPFWKRKVAASEKVVPRGYFQRRFWKIYPPLAISLLILTPFYVLDRSNDWSYVPIALRWLTGLAFFTPVSWKLNPVMWTLVLEVQFYIVLPLVFLGLKRFSARTCLAGFTVLFLVVPVLFRLLTGQTPTFQPIIASHFPSGLDSFYFGILIAGLDNLGWIKKTWVWWGVAGVVLWPLALFICGWTDMHPLTRTFMVDELEHDALKISAACLLLFIAQPQHPIARWLCAPVLRWCGIISYEWYLFHQPLIISSRNHFAPAGGSVYKYPLMTGIPLLISLILAAAVYWFFSLPILRYGRGKNQA